MTQPENPRPRATFALAEGLLVQIALLAALAATGPLPLSAGTAALAIYSLIAVLVWRHATAPFGLASRITAWRAGMIAVLPALVLAPVRLDPTTRWAVLGLGLVALVLDGLDGRIARHRGEASFFGARFDMEVDAAFVLFLSALVFAAGRAGAWILAAGLMRYAWVGAARLWPLLRQGLPPSLLRKSVCVAVLLLLLLALVLPPSAAAIPSGVALALLLVSFGRDLVWLLRGRGMAATHIQGAAAVYDGIPRVESE
jgi:phosphatidylglycerophosphate synthase